MSVGIHTLTMVVAFSRLSPAIKVPQSLLRLDRCGDAGAGL